MTRGAPDRADEGLLLVEVKVLSFLCGAKTLPVKQAHPNAQKRQRDNVRFSVFEYDVVIVRGAGVALRSWNPTVARVSLQNQLHNHSHCHLP